MTEIVLKHGIEFFNGELTKNSCRRCVEVNLTPDFIEYVEDKFQDWSECSCDLECSCICDCDETDCDCLKSDYCEDCLECSCGYSNDITELQERINEMIVDRICYWSFEKQSSVVLGEAPRDSSFSPLPYIDIFNIWSKLKEANWQEIRCRDLMYINTITGKFYFSKTA